MDSGTIMKLATVDSDFSLRSSRGDGASKRSSLSLHDLVTSPNASIMKGTATSSNKHGLYNTRDVGDAGGASNESFSEEYKTELEHLLVDLHSRRQSSPTPYEKALQHYLENKYKDLKQHEQSKLYSPPMPSPIHHHHSNIYDSSFIAMDSSMSSRKSNGMMSNGMMSQTRIDDLSRPSPRKVFQRPSNSSPYQPTNLLGRQRPSPMSRHLILGSSDIGVHADNSHYDLATRIRNRSRGTSLDTSRRNGVTVGGIGRGLQFVGGHYPDSEIYDMNLLSTRDLPSRIVTEDEFNQYLLDRDNRFYRRRIKSYREADRIDDPVSLNKATAFLPQINSVSSKLSDKANAKFINRVLSSSEHPEVLKSSIKVDVNTGDDSIVVHSSMNDKVVSNSLKKDSLTTNHMNARNNRSTNAVDSGQQQQKEEGQVIFIPGSDSYGVVDIKSLDVFDRLCLRSSVHQYRRSNSSSSDRRNARSASPAINDRSRQLVESQRSRIRARSSSPSIGPLSSSDYYAFHGVPERYQPPFGTAQQKDFLRGGGLSKSIQMSSCSSPSPMHARGRNAPQESRDEVGSGGDNNEILRGLNQLVRNGIHKYKLKSALSSDRDPSHNHHRPNTTVHVKSTFDERNSRSIEKRQFRRVLCKKYSTPGPAQYYSYHPEPRGSPLSSPPKRTQSLDKTRYCPSPGRGGYTFGKDTTRFKLREDLL